jgi:activator of HSP90 ATPase
MTTPEASAQKFAKNIRRAAEFEGDINLHELKGKYIKYVDLQSRLMIRKVVKVGPATVRIIDAAKKKHTVRHERILWAFPRRGSDKKLKVI